MKNGIITAVLSLICALGLSISALAQMGTIRGKVTDKQTGEPIPFVNVYVVFVTTNVVSGTTTDYNGIYKLPLPAGKYHVSAKFVGYDSVIVKDVLVRENEIRFIDIQLKASVTELEEVEVLNFSVPLINKNNTQVGGTHKSNGKALDGVKVKSNKSNVVDVDSEDDNIIIESRELQAGQLTASELNDFGKWELWKDIEKKDLKEMQKMWQLYPENRYSVQVKGNNNRPVYDAKVVLIGERGSVLWQSRTDNTGKAELWDGMFDGQTKKVEAIEVMYDGQVYKNHLPQNFNAGINVMVLPVDCKAPETIDIMFVVDATGSMNDEINYLKVELDNLISSVQENYPSLNTRTASVFYCADGNTPETFHSDFTTVFSVTSKFVENQSHNCGGEEAVDKAFDLAVNLNWSQSSHARLMFFMLDAPPYKDSISVKQLQNATMKAAEKGIRVIPIVCSAEEMWMAMPLEYLMRSIALATNGTYVFLTDHSQIGNEHAKPVTDSYDVELLNDLIKRLIKQYTYSTPCELNTEGKSDTTVVFAKKIIAHEVIDSTRTIASISPDDVIIDFRQDQTTITDTVTILPASEKQTSDNTKDDSNILVGKETGIKFFPNPTTGEITVLTNGDIKELQILDISGKLLQIVKAERETHINLAKYSSGIYFIRFTANGESFTGKVILR